MSGDASTILVGAAGTVVSGALSGQGSDKSIDGKVCIPSTFLLQACPCLFLSCCDTLVAPSSDKHETAHHTQSMLAADIQADFRST